MSDRLSHTSFIDTLIRHRRLLLPALVLCAMLCLLIVAFAAETEDDYGQVYADEVEMPAVAAGYVSVANDDLSVAASMTAASVEPEQGALNLGVGITEAEEVIPAQTVGEILRERGIEIYEGDIVTPSLDAVLLSSDLISIERARRIVITDGAAVIEIKSVSDDPQDWMAEAGLSLGEGDRLSDIAESDGALSLSVIRTTAEVVAVLESIPFKTVSVSDDSLEIGVSRTVAAGSNGLLSRKVRHYYENGQYLRSEELGTEIVRQPTDRVVAKGTVNTATKLGQTFRFTKTLMVKSSAYTAPGRLTFSETPARVGAIAVDPRVIPLGTRMYVEGYGFAVAEDTGGSIKGEFIDVYFDTREECIEWGVKYVKVYILE